MILKKARLVVMFVTILFGACVESFGLVEMISEYSKVAKNAEKPTTEPVINVSETTTTQVPPQTINNSSEEVVDYEDFDDLQEDRSFKAQSQTDTMMKYFNGLVSLLALMYKFNGRLTSIKPQSLHFKNKNEPRDTDVTKENKVTGKRFHEAQDRFEFPQKKFRYQGNSGNNMIDQQYQPLENYPPYNPLTANSAESYVKDDQRTSYDSDFMQYDSSKNTVIDYNQNNANVEVQSSYSYEIPYEPSKPNQQPTYDLTTTEDTTSWNNQNHENHYPVYKPWMSKIPTQDKPSSYQPWTGKIPGDDTKPSDSEPRQPWNGKPPADDFPIYHHDFKDTPSLDHHFEYQEIDHPVDEDRVSKKPYSYYFLGRKLWYIPLLFSVYFIIYVGALVLKSVARHKIQFPEKVWALHDDEFGHVKHRRHRKIDDVTERYENAIEKSKNKFM